MHTLMLLIGAAVAPNVPTQQAKTAEVNVSNTRVGFIGLSPFPSNPPQILSRRFLIVHNQEVIRRRPPNKPIL